MKTQISQTNLVEGGGRTRKGSPQDGDREEDGKAGASKGKQAPKHSRKQSSEAWPLPLRQMQQN